MKCKLCMNSSDFDKSHIIPESFYLQNKIEKETLLISSNRYGVYPKKRPVGEYDKNILCKNCEKKFSAWDNYGKILLLDKFNEFKAISEGNKLIGYQIDSFDYQKLKLFFISVLWRAGVSKQKFFKKVSLWPHEQTLKKMILNSKAGQCEDYAVHLFRFSQKTYILPVLMPMRIRSSYGYIYYRIYFGDYFVDVKVDKRNTPEKYAVGILCEDKPLLIALKNFKKSREYKIFKGIANAPNNKAI